MFHNFTSFIKHAWREPTTWIGAAILIGGGIYYKEIDTLIRNTLTSNELATQAANAVASLVGAYLIFKKSK